MRFNLRSLGPWLTILTLTAAGAAAAAGYALTAPKHYRATAQLLVTPVPAGDPTYVGLGLLRSGARQTAAASAAALLRSPQVADAVRAQLGLTRSRDSLLGAVEAHVPDGSDVVAITVEDTSAAGAAQLANAFADALVAQRTASFQSQLTTTIRRDEQLLRTTTGAGADELRRRLAVLRSLQGQPDPTLRSAGQASAAASAAWPKLPRFVAVGAAIGLAAGVLLTMLGMLVRSARAPRAAGAAEHDRQVPTRVVEELEARLLAKVDALVEERERLAGREAGLATREREITGKLEELRSALPGPDAEGELARREEALEARIAAVTRRELQLARRAGEVAARERALAAPAAQPSPAVETAGLAEREAELARRAAELDAREQELEQRAAVPEPEPEPAPPPPAIPIRPVVGGARGQWNLTSLERLVEERGREFPDRVDEWVSYLYFLREYAEADGTVPASFDWLIQDTFSELVA